MEFQAYFPKVHSNNGMQKWNLRIGIQAIFFIDWVQFKDSTYKFPGWSKSMKEKIQAI
jgi:hypothetical protein